MSEDRTSAAGGIGALPSEAGFGSGIEPAFPGPRGWRLAVLVGSFPLSAGAAWLATGWAEPDLSPAAGFMLGVMILAAVLWATEAISAVATALLVPALMVGGLGLPATFGAPWATSGEGNRVVGWAAFVAPAGDTVMLLMLGSLAMAGAARRTGLDARVGGVLLRPFLGTPGRLVLGVTLISAVLSMWTSNTATAAIMLSVTAPVWSRPTLARALRAGVPLGVALGANVGGIASPVGTPPTAIVFGALVEHGAPMDFLRWMARGLPLAGVMLAAGFVTLRWTLGLGRLPSSALDGHAFDPAPAVLGGSGAGFDRGVAPGWARGVTAGVFGVTVLLWVTGPWTGLPVAAVALVPLAVLPTLGVLRARDLAGLEWDVLLLILGGLILGVGMESTGLAARSVAMLPTGLLGGGVMVLIVAGLALVLSAFMSNTAVANLLCPVVMGLAAGLGGGSEALEHELATELGFAAAVGAGVSMTFPVSTPANALAARTGGPRTRDFLVVGTAVGLSGLAAVWGMSLLV